MIKTKIGATTCKLVHANKFYYVNFNKSAAADMKREMKRVMSGAAATPNEEKNTEKQHVNNRGTEESRKKSNTSSTQLGVTYCFTVMPLCQLLINRAVGRRLTTAWKLICWLFYDKSIHQNRWKPKMSLKKTTVKMLEKIQNPKNVLKKTKKHRCQKVTDIDILCSDIH